MELVYDIKWDMMMVRQVGSFLDVFSSKSVMDPGHVGSITDVAIFLDTVVNDAGGFSLLGHGGQESVGVGEDDVEFIFGQGVLAFGLLTMKFLEGNLTSVVEDERSLYKTICTNSGNSTCLLLS